MQGAVQQRKQAGLAGAVAADQTDLFAGVDRHRGVVEQDLGATPEAEILEDDHADDAVRRNAPPKPKAGFYLAAPIRPAGVSTV